MSETRVTELTERSNSGELIIRLQDRQGRAVTTSSVVVVEHLGGGGRYEARGRSGEASSFTFRVPAGRWRVSATADEFEDAMTAVTVSHRDEVERSLVLDRTFGDAAAEKDGNAYFLRMRAETFAAGRGGAKGVDTAGRLLAIAAKAKMGRPAELDGGPAGPPPGPPPATTNAWRCAGPRNQNGRVRTMTIHPNDGQRIWAGTANAGVWSSSDGGNSWSPAMLDQPILEIGAVACQLTNPAAPMGDVTIYAGLGEVGGGYGGNGVVKSTTSGSPGSWVATGAIPLTQFSIIVIDPATTAGGPGTSTIYAGGPAGLYRSTDGGAHWGTAPWWAKDVRALVFDPANAGVMYAAVAHEGVYKYTPGPGWALFNTGIAGPFLQLVNVAIGQSAPHKLYCKIDRALGGVEYDGEVFIYNTTTSSWQSLGTHGGNTYGFWSDILAVDPQNSDIVFAGGIGVDRTYDAGVHWQTGAAVHDDNHCLVFDPTNHFNVYVGDDGGVYKGAYASLTDTGTWTHESDGLVSCQLNSIGSYDAYVGDVVGSGSQDNGTVRTTGSLTWDLISGGDGSDFAIDPGNPLIQYAQVTTIVGGAYWNSHPFKSTDGGSTPFVAADTGFPDGPFEGRMVLDPNSPAEPNRVLFITGTTAIYRTVNSAGAWSVSSPALGGTPSAIAVAPSSSSVVYAGSNTGRVWRSSDGGATMANWHDITTATVAGSAVLPARGVTRVAVVPTDANTIYLTFDGYSYAASGSKLHVYRGQSTDGGATWNWTDISGSLPDIPVNALAIDHTAAAIWVGTDVGVFASDGSGTWAAYGSGMPDVVVKDLVLNPAGSKLHAATYGMGMWEIRVGVAEAAVDVGIRTDKLDDGDAPVTSWVQDPTTPGAQVYWWESPDIKIDAYPYEATPPDGVEFDAMVHENPVRNDAAHPNPNRVYVQVTNRGSAMATNVKIKLLWVPATSGPPDLPSDFWASFPNNWATASAWTAIDPPYQTIPQLAPHTPAVLMWNWTVPVSAPDHSCMIALCTADTDAPPYTDADPNSHHVWVVVPDDKHIAQKNLSVVTAAPPPPQGGGNGHGHGHGAPMRVVIDLHNPHARDREYDLVLEPGTLPAHTRVRLLLPKVKRRELAGVAAAGAAERTAHADAGDVALGFAEELELSEWQHNGTRLHPSVHGIVLPAKSATTVALVFTLHGDNDPGNVYQCALLQRMDGKVVGGNTIEIRVPPRPVEGHPVTK